MLERERFSNESGPRRWGEESLAIKERDNDEEGIREASVVTLAVLLEGESGETVAEERGASKGRTSGNEEEAKEASFPTVEVAEVVVVTGEVTAEGAALPGMALLLLLVVISSSVPMKRGRTGTVREAFASVVRGPFVGLRRKSSATSEGKVLL